MGNLLVSYLRLRNRASVRPCVAAVRARQGPESVRSLPCAPPSADHTEADEEEETTGSEDGQSSSESPLSLQVLWATAQAPSDTGKPMFADEAPPSPTTAHSADSSSVGPNAFVHGSAAALPQDADAADAYRSFQFTVPSDGSSDADGVRPEQHAARPSSDGAARAWGLLCRPPGGAASPPDAVAAGGAPAAGADERAPVEGDVEGVRRRSSDGDDADTMGPMDCADAFLYFRPRDGAYARAETVVYRAPGVAQLSTAALRARYQCPPAHTTAPTTAATTDGSSFRSLVETLRERCGVGPSATPLEADAASVQRTRLAVSWRSVDRVSYAEDGGAVPKTRAPSPSSSSDPDELAPDSVEAGQSGVPLPSELILPRDLHPAHRGRPLYYLGPQQHMTYGVLWAKVESFGWGLRSLGLRPGSTVGLCADTRWEWLVTCYACWSIGLVPVVFPNAGRCLRAVATEAPGMKVVVCQRSVAAAMRRHIRAAIALAKEVEEQAALPAGCSVLHAGSIGDEEAVGSVASRQSTTAVEEVPGPLERHEDARDDGSHCSSDGGRASAQTPLGPSARAPGRREKSAGTRELPLFVVMHDAPVGESKRSDPPATAGGRAAEEADEEALWWTDVLEHGEGKLYQHRTKVQRDLQQQRRAAALAARQQHQQELQAKQRRARQSSRAEDGGAGSANGSESSLTNATGTGGAPSSSVLTAGADETAAAAHACSAPLGTLTGRSPPRKAPVQRSTRRGPAAASTTAAPAAAAAAATTQPGSVGPTQFTARSSAPPAPSQARRPLPLMAAAVAQLSPLVPLRATDLAMVAYTEGEARGTLLTHGALVASVTAYVERLRGMELLPPAGTLGAAGGSNDSDADEESDGDAGKTTVPWTSLIGAPGAGADMGEAYLDPLLHTLGAVVPAHCSSSEDGEGHAGGYLSALSLHPRQQSRRLPSRRSTRPASQRRTYVAYMPLHNPLELVLESALLLHGDYLLCYGARQTLFNVRARPRGDLAEYKPLLLAGTPELFGRVCRDVEATIANGYRRLLFDVGYEERRQALRRGLETPYLNRAVFGQPRQVFGGRCRLAIACGGMLHPRTQEYMEVVTGTAVALAYAPVECAGCALLQQRWSGELGNLGGPLGAVEVKLRDVRGDPHCVRRAGGWFHRTARPCGELMLRGAPLASGYYRQVERAAEVLEEGGWLHTGDVVERQPDGSFRWLASLRPTACNGTGPRIALELLEDVFTAHPLCCRDNGSMPGRHAPMVCVLAHPYRPYLCALVLTDNARMTAFLSHPQVRRFLRRWRQREDRARDADRCSSADRTAPLLQWPVCLREPSVHAAAAASLNCLAHTSAEECTGCEVSTFERLKRVRVLPDCWTYHNGLRTATGKLRRWAVEERYADVIADLFDERRDSAGVD